MSVCAVAQCKNRKKDKEKDPGNQVSFHKFPKTSSIRSIWISRCGRTDKFNPDSATICSDHFTKEDYEGGSLRSELMAGVQFKKVLKRTAVPTISCHMNQESKVNTLDFDDVVADEDLDQKFDQATPEMLKEELKDMHKKLRLLVLEYEILKSKSSEQEEQIKILRKENSVLKKKLFDT